MVESVEKMIEIEQKIFKKVEDEYKKRGIEFTEEQSYFIRNVIKLGNVQGDGFKRISRIGEDKVFLVPLEDMILHGVKADELDKYEVEVVKE